MTFRNKLISILNGFINSVTMPDKWTPLATERAAICADCQHNVQRLNRQTCELCGCDIIAKTWSPVEFCPAGKWGAIEPSELTN